MEIVKENDKLKLVKKENNRLIFINNLGKEKRNFTFSINDYDRSDSDFMECMMNQNDFNASIHYLILNWIKEHGSGEIKLDRYGNLK